MPTVHIGVIGLGRMGQVYAHHIANQIEGVSLVAVADPREEVTSKVSSGAIYADYHELLNHPGENIAQFSLTLHPLTC